jgi:hypothetical protein
MNALWIVSFSILSIYAVAADPGATISEGQAFQKVRAVVAPVCGRGRAFSCDIAYFERREKCAFEYLVALPKVHGDELRKSFWVGLDHRGQVISLEMKRDDLCPSAKEPANNTLEADRD